MLSILRFIALSALAGLIALLVGFAAFVRALPQQAHGGVQGADAVVILTGGGGDRIRQGLRLFEDSDSERLLISGVYRDTRLEDIRVMAPGGMTRFECCVDLGFTARDTIGNGAETARWARDNGYDSISVVTHGYHMPRALIELRRAGPDIEYRPYPVGGPFARGMRQTTVEYLKFLVILLRDTEAEPEPVQNA